MTWKKCASGGFVQKQTSGKPGPPSGACCCAASGESWTIATVTFVLTRASLACQHCPKPRACYTVVTKITQNAPETTVWPPLFTPAVWLLESTYAAWPNVLVRWNAYSEPGLCSGAGTLPFTVVEVPDWMLFYDDGNIRTYLRCTRSLYEPCLTPVYTAGSVDGYPAGQVFVDYPYPHSSPLLDFTAAGWLPHTFPEPEADTGPSTGRGGDCTTIYPSGHTVTVIDDCV